MALTICMHILNNVCLSVSIYRIYIGPGLPKDVSHGRHHANPATFSEDMRPLMINLTLSPLPPPYEFTEAPYMSLIQLLTHQWIEIAAT